MRAIACACFASLPAGSYVSFCGFIIFLLIFSTIKLKPTDQNQKKAMASQPIRTRAWKNALNPRKTQGNPRKHDSKEFWVSLCSLCSLCCPTGLCLGFPKGAFVLNSATQHSDKQQDNAKPAEQTCIYTGSNPTHTFHTENRREGENRRLKQAPAEPQTRCLYPRWPVSKSPGFGSCISGASAA